MSDLRPDLQVERRQCCKRIENGGVAEGKEGLIAATPRRSSPTTPKRMRALERNVSRRSSTAFSELTRSDNVRKEWFVDWQRKKSERIANAAMAENKEGVGAPVVPGGLKKARENANGEDV